jgi:hypothetical protein
MPSAQAEAETSQASDLVTRWDQSVPDSLSSISASAVTESGTRSSASASTMSASPSLVVSEYSRRKSSMPPSPPEAARMAPISRRARASIRASASGVRRAVDRSRAARISSASA